MSHAWIRHPAVQGDKVVFVADDDVFGVSAAGGVARRLTTAVGTALRPRISPDGAHLSFDSSEEGLRDVFVTEADGGPVRRITWGGATNLGFTPDGDPVVATAQGRPFVRDTFAAVVPLAGGTPVALPFGPLAGLAAAPDGRVLVGRHQTDLGFWKGYRGGRMGVMWLGIPRGSPSWTAERAWEKLVLPFAAAHPTWCRGRFWFVGDPDRVPQLCSVDAAGRELRVHTALREGVRHPHADGERLVFVSGGDLYRVDADAEPVVVPIEVRTQRTDRQRRPYAASRFVDDVDLHPDGHSLCVSARGRIHVLGFWEGPVRTLGGADGVRHLWPRFVDRDRILSAADRDGEYRLELSGPRGVERRYDGFEHGRPALLEVDPTGRRAVFADHGHRLFLLDLVTGEARLLDTSAADLEVDWSADGGWLVWTCHRHPRRGRSHLRLLEVATGRVTDLTDGSWADASPSFDPDGQHLYFLSVRDFDPVADTVSFGYAFARGTRPFCIPLRKDLPHPFHPDPRPFKTPSAKSGERGEVVVDLDGIAHRVVAFPVAEARWTQVVGVGSGQVLLVRDPIRGTLDRTWADGGPPRSDATLCVWEFDKQELTELATRVGPLRVDRRRDQLVYRSGWRVRVAPARPDKAFRDELKKTEGRAERKSGWIDLSRIREELDPELEWPQMIRESWRLMRDHFWTPPDPGLLAETAAARDRAVAQLPRIATRAELSDLLQLLQGEWGTSHAYETGGDHPAVHVRRIGRLGADVVWDDALRGWRVTRIPRGDPGTPRSSPLLAPGAHGAVGDVIVAVDGRPVSADRPLEHALLDRADLAVALELARPGDGATRTAIVHPLRDDRELRYRDWVLGRRALVAARSAGRLGYLHVPNMGPSGFAEFHRDYAEAVDHDALLVDVRNNGGGHVSPLLLRSLAQRRIGRKHRRHGAAYPYPSDAPSGVMALLANESAGSDGDIFTHAWKRLGLGPVFGTRTWGGVVGILPKLRLVDRTITTQPEYASWFDDVGYGLENRGADPDVEVEVSPEVASGDTDPPLDLAIEHLLRTLTDPPVHPSPDVPGGA